MKSQSEKELIEECASICEKPWEKLGPSCFMINPESHDPLPKELTQRDLFSFINDIMKLRAYKIRALKD